MKDLKISAEEKKDMYETSIVKDTPEYPHGVKLYLDGKTTEKLGLSEAPEVGEKFMILAHAEVCEVRMERYEGDEKKIAMEMQITEMDLKESEEEKEKPDVATTLYGGEG